MINVTKTYLPPLDKYNTYVEKIFASEKITNNGSYVKELEKKLAKFLGVKHIVLVSNGTIALEIAYRALGLRGSAITTPFSFVATTSSLVTNNIRPIFVDIDRQTLNIDPDIIESQIEDDTSAIVPVHVFSNSCDIKCIQDIANRYDLKVIYDAAHAFGVKYAGDSILNFGDISTLSFHATKIFHTIEGGALIINDDDLVENVRYLINFGIKDAECIPAIGTNAKMNEFEAAMGLCILDDIEEIMSKRKAIHKRYVDSLSDLLAFQAINSDCVPNFSYSPVIFSDESKLIDVKKALQDNGVNPRRYFYPSLDQLPYVKNEHKCEISRDISSRILCLPNFSELSIHEQSKIIDVIRASI